MERAASARTKTDQKMEDQMHAVAGDPERVDVLAKARTFKRSWIELAEALARTCERESWRRWGFADFETYCRRELHLTPSTVQKLLGSFRFLKTSEPAVIARTARDPEAPVPSLQAVDFVARASERGAADEEAMSEIRRAAFDEGASAPMLSRRYKEVAFPVSDEEKRTKLRGQITSAARRLADLLADPDTPIPHDVAARAEEAIGELLAALE
jgi:hypothetical protein